MNIIKLCFVFLLMSNSCDSHKKSTNAMTNTPSEVIIYGKKESGLSYKNDLFKAHNNADAARINEILYKYDLTVKQIKSRISDSSSIGLAPMFSIMINPQEAKSLCEQLNIISIIDGAYIKPKTEEPSIDDFN